MKIIFKPNSEGLIYMKDNPHAIYGIHLWEDWHCNKAKEEKEKYYLLALLIRNLRI